MNADSATADGAPVSRAEATLDSIDAGALGSILVSRRLRSPHPLLRPDNEYFITTAVVRSPSVSVVGEGSRRRRVELAADIMAVARAKAGRTVEQEAPER
jgi:hypothetical protein